MQNFLIDSAFFGAVISLAAYEGGLLLKKKYRLAYGGRCQQVADILCAFLIVTVFHVKKHKHRHDTECSDQQRIQDGQSVF